MAGAAGSRLLAPLRGERLYYSSSPPPRPRGRPQTLSAGSGGKPTRFLLSVFSSFPPSETLSGLDVVKRSEGFSGSGSLSVRNAHHQPSLYQDMISVDPADAMLERQQIITITRIATKSLFFIIFLLFWPDKNNRYQTTTSHPRLGPSGLAVFSC
jgi:hypothetical protein